MSALCGLLWTGGRPAEPDDAAPMLEALAPFGRHRSGILAVDGLALGARLTRLLPEDAYDRQPLAGGGGRYRLAADIRLDNRPELTDALGISPHRAAGMCDAELLLAAWEKWQTETPGHLIGNFAFALWDRAERRLHLVRDQLGERPLFYHQSAQRFAFASLYHGLHALPDVPLVPDLAAVRAYAAFFADYRDRSFHAGVKRVMPGSRLEISADGTCRTDIYWQLPPEPPAQPATDAGCIELFRECFDRAIRDRLRRTGGIACHLSSGYDSSAVATTAAPMLAAEGARLSAYTAVPMAGVPLTALPGQIIDESPIARITAAGHPNIDHYFVGADGRGIGGELPEIFRFWQQPARNLCNRVWRTDIARQMQQRGETVLLNGAFGNLTVSYHGREGLPEMLLTGDWLRLARELWLLSRGEASLKRMLMNTLLPFVPQTVQENLRRLLGRHSTSRRTFSPLRDAALETLLAEEAADRIEHLTDMGGFCYRSRIARIRAGLGQADVGAHGKFMLGAYGTDERDATRDLRLVQLTLSLPAQLFIRNGQARWIYRQAFAGRVPPEVMTPLKLKGFQGADWMHRLARGRDRLNRTIRRGAAVPEIAALFDMNSLTHWTAAPLDYSRSHLPAVQNPFRFRFLTGVANIDFLLRAGLDPDFSREADDDPA
jgi:asparagine synthase (glutamine-hydrolysing)